jgi:hypothetical protein
VNRPITWPTERLLRWSTLFTTLLDSLKVRSFTPPPPDPRKTPGRAPPRPFPPAATSAGGSPPGTNTLARATPRGAGKCMREVPRNIHQRVEMPSAFWR